MRTAAWYGDRALDLPFTVLGRRAVEARLGVRLNHRIQEWADGGVPVIRWTGSQYLVASRRGI